MIGSIKGKIILKKDKFVIVEQSGIGYKIGVSSNTQERLLKTNNEVSFWTHLHVKEDAQDLYGFLERSEGTRLNSSHSDRSRMPSSA